jgi:hypothetical protein
VALRKGSAAKAWFFAAAVSVFLTAAGWSVSGPSARGRFTPDEIIVKFRGPVPDADLALETTPDGNSALSRDLRVYGSRFRVREVRPILRDSDCRRARSDPLRGLESPQLTQRQKRLLQRQQRATTAGGRVELGNIYRVRLDLPAGASLDEVLAAYRRRPDVEYAEPNPVIAICATPNDKLYADQWALAKIHAPDAWDTCRGSHEVVVAVIDTGVDYDHPDLQGNLWTNGVERNGLAGVDDDKNGYIDDIRGYNFITSDSDPLDDHGHGTVVAGIIAAVGNNAADVAGVCWLARLMPLKILGVAGDGTVADAVPAIHYAVAEGADIICASWGGAEGSDALRDAVAYACQEGVIVVAAAGNSGSDTPYYPAAYPGVISVAATDVQDRRWHLSNYGDWVDLAAPGSDIVSLRAMLPGQATRGGLSSRMSGTSMAAPHAVGACALLLAANPLLRCDELPPILTANGDPIEPGICSSDSRLNVDKALRAVIPPGGTIRMDRASYAQGAEIGLLLADWRLRGAGQCTVLMQSASDDQETVTLLETDVSLGVFRGTIPSHPAAVTLGDGIIQVQDAQSILARYLDAGAGLDIAGQWRSATAVADYQPPTVLSLEIESEGAVTTIDLRTSEPTRAQIRYGTTPGGPYDLLEKAPGLREQHHIELRRLTPQTPYYFVAALTDEAGNETVADNEGQGYSFIAQP